MFLGIGAKQCVPELAQRLLNLIQRVADLTLQKTCCGLFWFLLSWHINCVCVCLSSMSYFTPRKFLNPTRAIYIYMYLNIQYTYIINKSYNLGAHSLVDFFSCEQVKRLGFLVTSSYRTCFGPAEGWHRLAAEATGELLKALTNLQQIAAALHKGIDLEKDATFLDAKDVGSQVRICEFLC